MTFQPYVRCYRCSGEARPGTKNLLGYLLQRFPETFSLGIYNCRVVAGTTSLSQHACGRAFDQGIPVLSNGRANTALGYPPLRLLAEHSTELGLVTLIYDRVIYDDRSPRGRYYGGVHPHYNHIHGDQTEAKAVGLSYTAIVNILGPIPGGNMITRSSRGEEVIDLQHTLNRFGLANPALDLDGIPGDLTFAAYNRGLDLIGRSHNDVQISAWNMVHIARVLGGGVNAYTKVQSDQRYVQKGTKSIKLN